MTLVAADGRALTRDQLLDAVYGSDDGDVLDRTIDVHIGRLREKLGDDAEQPRYVMTVRGVGYRAAPPLARGTEPGMSPESEHGHRRPPSAAAWPGASRWSASPRPCVAVGIVTAWRLGLRQRGPGALVMMHGARRDRRRTPTPCSTESIRDVLVVATLVAIIASVALAVVLSRMIARPLADIGAAARRLADGDLSIRVPRAAPDELASLADSFNQMAAELEESERQRRDIIANTAHELRTPLTNLEGYLEAIRDGVIEPDQGTYESLLEETERLARLARSLDDLALGDAAHKTAHPVEVDLAALLIAAAELARPPSRPAA